MMVRLQCKSENYWLIPLWHVPSGDLPVNDEHGLPVCSNLLRGLTNGLFTFCLLHILGLLFGYGPCLPGLTTTRFYLHM